MNIVATDDIVVNVKDLLVKCFSSSNLLIFNSITVHGYHIKPTYIECSYCITKK